MKPSDHRLLGMADERALVNAQSFGAREVFFKVHARTTSPFGFKRFHDAGIELVAPFDPCVEEALVLQSSLKSIDQAY